MVDRRGGRKPPHTPRAQVGARHPAPRPPAARERRAQLVPQEVRGIPALPAQAWVGDVVPGTEVVAAALLRWELPDAQLVEQAPGRLTFLWAGTDLERLLAVRALIRVWARLQEAGLPGLANGAALGGARLDAEASASLAPVPSSEVHPELPVRPGLVAWLRRYAAARGLEAAVVTGEVSAVGARVLVRALGLRPSRLSGRPGTLALHVEAEDSLLVEVLGSADYAEPRYGLELGLSRPLAACLCALTQPGADDLFVDPLCGNGSILVERSALGPARRLVGLSPNGQGLAEAARNLRVLAPLRAPGSSEPELRRWLGGRLPVVDGVVDAVASRLPAGADGQAVDLLGLLSETARILKPGRLAVWYSQEPEVPRAVILDSPLWTLEREFAVGGGLRGAILVCRRVSQGG